MGDWFRQILFQGFIIGVAAALLVYLPWGWAKIVLFVLLVYVLLMMGRNPLFFYRQIIRALALASMLTLGVSGRLTGNVVLPQGWGALDYFVELGGNAPGWIALILAICVAADFGFALFQERTNHKLIGAITLDMKTQVSREGVEIYRPFTLTGQKDCVTLTGAELRVGLFGKPDLATQLYRMSGDGPERSIRDQDHITVQPGQAISLAVEAKARKGIASAIFGSRLKLVPRLIFPVRGRLRLLRGTESPTTIPVRFTP